MPSTAKKRKSSLSARSKPTATKRKTAVPNRAGTGSAFALGVGGKSSRSRLAKKQAPGFPGGSYLTPRGNVTVGIPSFWTLRQTNDDLEVESPSGETSVIVTAFHRTDGSDRLDAREYLESFLRTAPVKGRPTVEKIGRGRALTRFRDVENEYWQVEFLTDGETLLLATMNSSLSARSQEARVGSQVLSTLSLKAK